MRYHYTKRLAKKLVLTLLIAGLNFQAFSQDRAPRLSVSAALGIPVTMFSINSKPVGIYTAAARYSFNKNWSLEAKVTSNTFYNNATGHTRKAKLDGTASDVLTYRTPIYGLNGIFYYNIHNIFGLDRLPDSKWLPYVNFGGGLNWYKPSASFADGKTAQATSFGKPFRDYQLGLGTRYYVNHIIDLYGGAEYHYVESYYLDAIREASNPSYDDYFNFYAGLSVKLGSKKHNNLIDWSKKNVEKQNEDPKDYSQWAVDGTVGLPVLFTPVGYNFTGMFGLGLRYSFNNFLSGQLNFAYGKVAGDQETSGTQALGSAENVKEFSTSLRQISGRVLLNLRSFVAEPANRMEWNHYAVFGAGYTKARGDVTYANGNSINDIQLSLSPGIQTIVLGYQARKYINHQFDAIGGLDFNYNQSKYIDNAYNKSGMNHHLYFHAGVTYKIGTTKDKEHIDWAYENYNNFKNKKTTLEQVPVIEKPVTEEPKIETTPVVVEPAVEPAPKVEPTPAVEPTPVVEPAPKVTPKTAPKAEPAPVSEPNPAVTPAPRRNTPRATTPRESAPVTETKPYVATDDVTPPPSRYNVIVGCYSVNKLSVAKNTQRRLAAKGFEPSIYRSSMNSRMLRMSVISTDDRSEAIKVLRKARKEVDPGSWLYIYNAQ